MSEFKVGDRVRAYSAASFEDGEKCGTVKDYSSGMKCGFLLIRFQDGSEFCFHPKQCRKLKPKEKSVRVTRKSLEAAWSNVVGLPEAILDRLIKELGL